MRINSSIWVSSIMSVMLIATSLSAIWPFGKQIEPAYVEKLARLVRAKPILSAAVVGLPVAGIGYCYRKPITHSTQSAFQWIKQHSKLSIAGAGTILASLCGAYNKGYFDQKFLMALAIRGEKWVLKNQETLMGIGLFLALGVLGSLVSRGESSQPTRQLLDEPARNELMTILNVPLVNAIDISALSSFKTRYDNHAELALIVDNFVKKRTEIRQDVANAPARMGALVEATKEHLSKIVVPVA